MRQRSQMNHEFSQVPVAKIERSAFKRDHDHKFTMDAGYLVPFFCDEALPGDTMNFSATMIGRLNTPIVPIMDNMHLDIFYFAVPLRLLWDNFKKFMGEQDDPGDSTDFTCPKLNFSGASKASAESLHDYLGLPIEVTGLSVNAFWHRAYNLIFKEWFRDQNLINSPYIQRGDGPDDSAFYTLRRRCKRHDYFTSALPWPQKGPGVELPLGESAPVTVYGSGESLGLNDGSNNFGLRTYGSGGAAGGGADSYNVNVGTTVANTAYTGSKAVGVVTDANASGLTGEADLSNATAATINSLRQAFQIQKVYERDARGGTRYIEMVKAHFGVDSPDARQQRPEYLGGSSNPVMIQQVPQTSSTDGTSPQGNLAAYGTVQARGVGFTKSFTEHCVVMGICNVRADLTYQQGIDKMFLRDTRFDFYMPALAHLGEQSILNKEIYYQDAAPDTDVFGYQERWSEYRYKNSRVSGKLKSTAPSSLDVWHLAQEFTSLPTLSQTFIEEDPPLDRVVATPTEPHFNMDCYMKLRHVRPMPVYSVPGKIDHF